MKTLVKELFVRYSYEDYELKTNGYSIIEKFGWTILPIYIDDDTHDVVQDFEMNCKHDITIVSVNTI